MPDIENRLARIERKLDQLLKKQPKALWVKVGVITQLTGWTKSQMQDAREQALIEWKKNSKGIWYNLNSVNHLFIKQTKENGNE